MDNRLILVTLLIRLGVAAAISSVLVRARIRGRDSEQGAER